MKRRTFVAALGGMAAWPLVGRAQQRPIPVIGYLSSQPAGSQDDLVAAFRRGLSEFGYVEGQNVSILYSFAENKYDRLPTLAADLVNHGIAVIVAVGGAQTAVAAKSATTTISIVFDINDDPIKLGLVASLNRPGGNATGVSFFTPTLDAKRLELLHDLTPKARACGVLVNPDAPITERVLREIEEVARTIGLQLHVVRANSEPNIDAAFETLTRLRAEALVVATDPFFTVSRQRIVESAARYAIPAIYGRREFVASGGLISYGESLIEAYQQVGIYTGKILKGVKPAELPTMQLTKVELVINLNTAQKLGLTFPPSLLARADEVIE